MAAVAAGNVANILNEQPGGLQGVIDSTAVKPIYFILFVLFIVGLILFVSGKYFAGATLFIVAGGAMFAMFYLRSKYTYPEKRNDTSSSNAASGAGLMGMIAPFISKFKGGDDDEILKDGILMDSAKSKKYVDLIELHNTLNLDSFDTDTDKNIDDVFIEKLIENKEKAKTNFSHLTEAKQNKVIELVDEIDDNRIGKIFN